MIAMTLLCRKCIGYYGEDRGGHDKVFTITTVIVIKFLLYYSLVPLFTTFLTSVESYERNAPDWHYPVKISEVNAYFSTI